MLVDGSPSSPAENLAGYSIKWRSLTAALLVVTVASLAALVVVVSIKDVDVLSTVALALAVLAFAAQLIVSLGQAQQSTNQLTQSERINSQTQTALADVRSTSQALLSNQVGLFNKLLDAALPRATKDALIEAAAATTSLNRSMDLDPDDFVNRVERKLKDAITDLSPLIIGDITRQNKLSEWVDEPVFRDDFSRVIEILKALNELELAMFLQRVARPVVRSGQRDQWIVLHDKDMAGLEDTFARYDLMKSDKNVQVKDGGQLVKLGDNGVLLMQVLFGRKPIPLTEVINSSSHSA